MAVDTCSHTQANLGTGPGPQSSKLVATESYHLSHQIKSVVVKCMALIVLFNFFKFFSLFYNTVRTKRVKNFYQNAYL